MKKGSHSGSATPDSGAPTPGRRSLDPSLVRTRAPDEADEPLEDDWLREIAAAPPVVSAVGPGVVVDGSYEIEAALGKGGMGKVYLARDLQLDRPVALKMVTGSASAIRLVRFRREARAMARLSHPNVLTVYEVGPFRGQLYIAMEYAEGGTAGAWMEAEPRSWQEILGLWMQAGRGLAAAHRVGVVHRDFKPDNVLIRSDGRAQVADFGLAQGPFDTGAELEELAAATAPGQHEQSVPRSGNSHRNRLTETGSAVGTPFYMSPEQFAGLRVGPHSDQFAFCVVLYEALFGHRPFTGATTVAIAESVCAGRVRSIDDRRGVPGAIVRLILRGLDVDPQRRFESMDALLDAIEDVLAARRRRLFFAGAGIIGVAALVAGFGASTVAETSPCESVGEPMRAVWDAPQRDAVANHLRSAGASQAQELVAALDTYARAWIDQRQESCIATRIRGDQAEFAMQLRHACLDRQLAQFDGLVSEVAAMSGPVQESELGDLVPALVECENLDALEDLENRLASASARPLPDQRHAHTRAVELVTRADVRTRSGQPGASQLARQARDLAADHDLFEVEAAALRLLAHQARMSGEAEEADTLYQRALDRFATAGVPWGVAEQMLYRARSALTKGDLAAAAIHLDYGGAFIEQVHDKDQVVRLRALQSYVAGRLASRQHRPREALALLQPLLGGPLPEHTVHILSDLGRAHQDLGQAEAAADRFGQALARLEQQPSEAGVRAQLLNNLANARLSAGRIDAAVETYEEAIALATKEERLADVARMRGNLGHALRVQGHLDEARVAQEAALIEKIEHFGSDDPRIAFTLDELGALARLDGRLDEALKHLNRAGRIRDAAFGPGHPDVANTLTEMGRVFLARDDMAQAAGALQVALEIRTKHELDPAELGEVQYLLARATWGSEQAPALLTSAQRRLRNATGPHALVREEMMAWMRASSIEGTPPG